MHLNACSENVPAVVIVEQVVWQIQRWQLRAEEVDIVVETVEPSTQSPSAQISRMYWQRLGSQHAPEETALT